MFLFLYGKDTYRSLKKLQEIIERYKKIHQTGLNLRYYDCQNSGFEEFEHNIQSVSMFKEKKLIVLKNIFLNSEFKEKILDVLKKIENTEDVILFYEKDKVNKADSLFKFLKKTAKCQEFDTLSNKELENWIKKEFEKYNSKIENQAIQQLINFVGNNLWQLSQEIKKLCTYKFNTTRSVLVVLKDIELLVAPRIETDIFKTIDAIAQKDKKRAIFLIHKHLEKGDAPLYLLSMINFQFRNLLLVKDYLSSHSEGVQPNNQRTSSFGRVKIPGMHPYVAQKSCYQAQKFGLDVLKKIYQKLFKVDRDIKTGRVDPIMAIDMLITEI